MGTDKIKSAFQLMTHSVDELNVKNTLMALGPDDERILRDFSVENAEMHEDEAEYFGEVTIFINIQCKKKGARKKNISVKLKLTGLFTAEKTDEMTKNNFQRMLITNGTSSLYSIARAIISTTTSQCLAAGHVILPMVNVFQILGDVNTSFDIVDEDNEN